ncbi:MAG TPA: DUF945 domain-containing protein [Gammaproteobacteria bacterium]|nr:DUF945 domain-containing protein [Gammaproteobacteria bacterium]
MKTPKEKYMNDPEYRSLVNMLENLIAQAHFTPSELREACVLASINYERWRIRHSAISNIHPNLEDALRTLDEFVSIGRPRR